MVRRIMERAKTSGRADDNAETVKLRLLTYQKVCWFSLLILQSCPEPRNVKIQLFATYFVFSKRCPLSICSERLTQFSKFLLKLPKKTAQLFLSEFQRLSPRILSSNIRKLHSRDSMYRINLKSFNRFFIALFSSLEEKAQNLWVRRVLRSDYISLKSFFNVYFRPKFIGGRFLYILSLWAKSESSSNSGPANGARFWEYGYFLF